MNLEDMFSDDLVKAFKLKCEPAEGGAVVSLFLPSSFGALVPGLLVAGMASGSMDKNTERMIAVLGKQLMNAFAGKHSDENGNAVPAPAEK